VFTKLKRYAALLWRILLALGNEFCSKPRLINAAALIDNESQTGGETLGESPFHSLVFFDDALRYVDSSSIKFIQFADFLLHRSPIEFLGNLVCGLIAQYHPLRKPSLQLDQLLPLLLS